MALFGVILTIRTRHKRPAITATWHEERSASSDPGGSERVITIRQDDDEAKWQVFSVTVQGCRDNLVSRRGCEKTYQRLRLITPYVGPEWTRTVPFKPHVPLGSDQLILSLHPKADLAVELRMRIKPNGGCWVPYWYTYSCHEYKRRTWGAV